MKKLLAILLITVLGLLPLLSAAFCEDNTEAEPFTFRDGVTWGMDRDKVISLEGKEYEEDEKEGRTWLIYKRKKVGAYECKLIYAFSSDTLDFCSYWLDEVEDNVFDNLIRAYSLKYGDPEEVSSGEFIALSKRLTPSTPLKNTDLFSVCKWEPEKGTTIYMFKNLNTKCIRIYYMSPDGAQAGDPGQEIDLIGL